MTWTKAERRSGQYVQLPNPMLVIVRDLPPWKLHVMFFFGLAGAAAILYWFAFPAPGHEHGKLELTTAAIFFGGCTFFAFPVGVAKLLDMLWPAKWRIDPRGSG